MKLMFEITNTSDATMLIDTVLQCGDQVPFKQKSFTEKWYLKHVALDLESEQAEVSIKTQL